MTLRERLRRWAFPTGAELCARGHHQRPDWIAGFTPAADVYCLRGCGATRRADNWTADNG